MGFAFRAAARQRLGQRLVTAARWVMPPVCVVCGGMAGGRDLCRACAVALPWNRHACSRCALPLAADGVCGTCLTGPPPWRRAYAPLLYRFPVDSLLCQLKFSGRLPHARVLGELLGEWVASNATTRPDLLVPVPLHWRRQLARRFNQAAEIARPVARRLDIPIATRLCHRRRPTPAQSGLPARQRRRNLRNAFVVRTAPAGARLALIDDVLTTGSTLTELGRALLRAGAAQIEVWTVARVDRPAN